MAQEIDLNGFKHVVTDNLSAGFFMAVDRYEARDGKIYHTCDAEVFSPTLRAALAAIDDFQEGKHRILHVTATGCKDVTKEAAQMWLDNNMERILDCYDPNDVCVPEFIDYELDNAMAQVNEAGGIGHSYRGDEIFSHWSAA